MIRRMRRRFCEACETSSIYYRKRKGIDILEEGGGTSTYHKRKRKLCWGGRSVDARKPPPDSA